VAARCCGTKRLPPDQGDRRCDRRRDGALRESMAMPCAWCRCRASAGVVRRHARRDGRHRSVRHRLRGRRGCRRPENQAFTGQGPGSTSTRATWRSMPSWRR
jgi:hypothetical protein